MQDVRERKGPSGTLVVEWSPGGKIDPHEIRHRIYELKLVDDRSGPEVEIRAQDSGLHVFHEQVPRHIALALGQALCRVACKGHEAGAHSSRLKEERRRLAQTIIAAAGKDGQVDISGSDLDMLAGWLGEMMDDARERS